MTGRTDSTGSYTQAFNVENELTTVTKGSNVTTFAYDAAGIRVKTVEPDGVITDYPFPGYEVENPGLSGQTVRLTLALAGQAVAVRVVTSSSSNLYYLYNDHLGSTTAVADSGGNLVAGSRAYYAPFGAYRGTAPTQTVTDRGFTGHLHNNTGANGIGLIYMQARFYVPGIGRFASADTIVPDPTNPQSFNRYSYVNNNPLNYVDPSGHCEQDGDESCWSFAEQIGREYGISLEFLALMNVSQMRFFIEGLNAARDIDSSLPEQIIASINNMDEEFTDWFNRFNHHLTLDAIGIRVSYNAGSFIGGGADLDFVFNFQSWEFSIFATPGVQAGALAGESVGVGIYLGFEAPTNSAYWGWGTSVTAAAADGLGGGIQYNDSGKAYSVVIGGNAGLALDVTVGVGYTVEILRHSSSPSGANGNTVLFPQLFYLLGQVYGWLGE